jgi:hypothetical protein
MLYEVADMIEDTPTAYDVDKAVEKLMGESSYIDPPNYIGKEHVYRVDLDRAIDIVKQGGVTK